MTAAQTPTNTSDRALREAMLRIVWDTLFRQQLSSRVHYEKAVRIGEHQSSCVREMTDQTALLVDRLCAGPIAALRAEIERLKGALNGACDGTCCDGYEGQIAVLQSAVRDRTAAHDALASELGRTCGELMTARVALEDALRAITFALAIGDHWDMRGTRATRPNGLSSPRARPGRRTNCKSRRRRPALMRPATTVASAAAAIAPRHNRPEPPFRSRSHEA